MAHLLAVVSAALGGLTAFNLWARWSAGPAYNRLGGTPSYFAWRRSRVFYTVEGEGAPLVLVHRPSWAAASVEWRRVFSRLSAERRVYALDLLGFGLSDRPALRYEPTLYIDLLGDFLQAVVGRPATVVATGLSAAYAIEVAARWPERIARLLLVSPTWGLRRSFGAALGALLRTPVVGTSAFNVLASRRLLRHRLENRVFYDPTLVDDDLVEALYALAQRPGSTRAVAALLAGDLNHDATAAWGRVTQPALIVRGEDVPEDGSVAALLAHDLPAVRQVTIPACGLLPQEEHPQRFAALVLESGGMS
jgi:pimeloyl-ACP methyl ester carboxylesterase